MNCYYEKRAGILFSQQANITNPEQLVINR